MTDTVLTYKGRPVTDLTKDELVDAMTWAFQEIEYQRERADCFLNAAALAEPEPEPKPEPVAWMYQGEPSFDGTDWRETWEVTMDKRLAEFKATPDQPIPLFSIQPQRQ